MQIKRHSLLLLLLSALASSAQMPGVAEPIKIVTGPVLQNASESTMTIGWITNRNATAGVEYGPADGQIRTAFSSHDGLIDCNERIHKVVLTGLKPGTVYRYRVISRDIVNFGPYKVDFGETVSAPFQEFRTFDRRKQAFSFLVFNDIHDTPKTIPELLAVAGSRPYDFVCLNGDTLSDIENEGQITAILDAAVESFAARTPLVWARGNHETRGAFARQLPLYLDSPNGHYFYSFDQGPVHFVVLDTGEDKTDSSVEYSGLVSFFPYRRQEAEWLRSEVKSEAFQRAKYRVVFAHMPFPSASRTQRAQSNISNGMTDAFQNFGAILNQAGIDMMISGHVHTPAVIDAELGRHNYPIVRGGGPKAQGRTIIRVDVNERELEATILRPDGSVFGACRVPAKR